MLANVGQPIVVMHPNATLRLSPVASALARLGLLTRDTVAPRPFYTPRFHAHMGTIRGGIRA